MKVVVDKDIPFIKGVLEPYFDVVYLSGKDIVSDDVADACGMVIRTRTKCNEKLLENSSVKFIATATIGTDHIDMEYCGKAGITVENAAGCNAGGVMQYVFTALYALAVKKGFSLPCGNCGEKNVLGVVGVGNVGSRVAELGEMLGFEVLRCDPKLKDGCSLDYLLKNSDIVTMHTWLDSKTRGMADADFFAKMKDGAIFINASRGEVVDDDALLQNIGRFDAVVIDVWNGEPSINPDLLEKADIATPHIAGYSYEGKLNGTSMAVRSLAKYFGIEELKDFEVEAESPNTNLLSFYGSDNGEICRQLTGFFPIFEDDSNLRQNPHDFEKLRSNYKYRREFYVNPTTKTANR